jgi:hypothetical protein
MRLRVNNKGRWLLLRLEINEHSHETRELVKQENGTEKLNDAQPRCGNRQTEKRLCKLEQLSCFIFERFQSVYRLRPAPSLARGGLRPPC